MPARAGTKVNDWRSGVLTTCICSRLCSVGEGRWGLHMQRVYAKPLDQLRVGAYRRQRWDAVTDLLDDGYVQRLPPKEREWMQRYLREQYGANATALRTGLHADVPRVIDGPLRARRWWRGVERLWPGMTQQQRDRARLRAERERLSLQDDPRRRRAVYAEQNAATRDVYSLRRVVYLEDGGSE